MREAIELLRFLCLFPCCEMSHFAVIRIVPIYGVI